MSITSPKFVHPNTQYFTDATVVKHGTNKGGDLSFTLTANKGYYLPKEMIISWTLRSQTQIKHVPIGDNVEIFELVFADIGLALTPGNFFNFAGHAILKPHVVVPVVNYPVINPNVDKVKFAVVHKHGTNANNDLKFTFLADTGHSFNPNYILPIKHILTVKWTKPTSGTITFSPSHDAKTFDFIFKNNYLEHTLKSGFSFEIEAVNDAPVVVAGVVDPDLSHVIHATVLKSGTNNGGDLAFKFTAEKGYLFDTFLKITWLGLNAERHIQVHAGSKSFDVVFKDHFMQHTKERNYKFWITAVLDKSQYHLNPDSTAVSTIGSGINLYAIDEHDNLLLKQEIIDHSNTDIWHGGVQSPGTFPMRPIFPQDTYILRNIKFPFSVDKVKSKVKEKIRLGKQVSTVSATILNHYRLDVMLGRIKVFGKYGNSFDFVGTKIYLQVPFLNRIFELDVSSTMLRNITVVTRINLYTGDAVLLVYNDLDPNNDNALFSADVKYGQNLPMFNNKSGSVDDAGLTNISLAENERVKITVVYKNPYYKTHDMSTLDFIKPYKGLTRVDNFNITSKKFTTKEIQEVINLFKNDGVIL
jgi:hypothetical protein